MAKVKGGMGLNVVREKNLDRRKRKKTSIGKSRNTKKKHR